MGTTEIRRAGGLNPLCAGFGDTFGDKVRSWSAAPESWQSGDSSATCSLPIALLVLGF